MAIDSERVLFERLPEEFDGVQHELDDLQPQLSEVATGEDVEELFEPSHPGANPRRWPGCWRTTRRSRATTRRFRSMGRVRHPAPAAKFVSEILCAGIVGR